MFFKTDVLSLMTIYIIKTNYVGNKVLYANENFLCTLLSNYSSNTCITLVERDIKKPQMKSIKFNRKSDVIEFFNADDIIRISINEMYKLTELNLSNDEINLIKFVNRYIRK